jgi:hypothetical protein
VLSLLVCLDKIFKIEYEIKKEANRKKLKKGNDESGQRVNFSRRA